MLFDKLQNQVQFYLYVFEKHETTHSWLCHSVTTRRTNAADL